MVGGVRVEKSRNSNGTMPASSSIVDFHGIFPANLNVTLALAVTLTMCQ